MSTRRVLRRRAVPLLKRLSLNANTLSICEIFDSIQGESTWAGLPCTFIRLAGCHLRCSWCDTSYSFTGGKKLTCSHVFERVKDANRPIVEVTGGEPLLQPAVYPLLEALLKLNRPVLLETSGTLDISNVPSDVHRIVDMKAPSSGVVDRNCYENLDLLDQRDELKIVILNRGDYEWARELVQSKLTHQRARAIVFSPVHGKLDAAELSEWILEDSLAVRLGLQLHKVIWPDAERGK